MHPAHERLLTYFRFTHLPPALQAISRPIGALALDMAALLYDAEDDAEVTTGLRKLLEAKDCFVRAALTRPMQEP